MNADAWNNKAIMAEQAQLNPGTSAGKITPAMTKQKPPAIKIPASGTIIMLDNTAIGVTIEKRTAITAAVPIQAAEEIRNPSSKNTAKRGVLK